MEKEAVFLKVRDVIAKQIRKKPEDIKLEHRVMEDLGADSLDIVEMLMTLEEDYEVVIPDETAMNFKTVNDVVVYLSELK
ncbi:MAG: acyl carrier protein [Firmicutes bacterium]|nr:acyl carrier protein [Bacillota bacterium]